MEIFLPFLKNLHYPTKFKRSLAEKLNFNFRNTHCELGMSKAFLHRPSEASSVTRSISYPHISPDDAAGSLQVATLLNCFVSTSTV